MKFSKVKECQLLAIGYWLSAISFQLSAQDKTFKTDPVTSVQYRFVKHNANGVKPKEGDFAHIVMLWSGKNTKGDADSTFLDSHKKNGDSNGALLQAIPLNKSFHGCLEQGILMMAKGDSAVFRINTDSLIMKTFHYPAGKPLPPYVKSNPYFTFSIKLISFQTQQEVTEEKQKQMQKQKEQTMMRKGQENVDIAAYLKKNYPNAKPTPDSLFILTQTSGTGKQVMEGDSVEMGYIGTLLDGTLFDKSSPNKGSAFKFVFTKNMALIQGWLKILPTLHEGDKVKVLIPSSMAYGSRGAGPKIPGYTPLIFDLEVLGVKSNGGH